MFQEWEPSCKAVALKDDEVETIIKVLEYIMKKEPTITPFAIHGNPATVLMNLRSDGLSPLDAIQAVLQQGQQHRKFWFSHLEMDTGTTVETAIVTPAHTPLRYLKLQMMGKGMVWKNPGNIKHFRICYHPST